MDFNKQLVWTCKPRKYWKGECTTCCGKGHPSKPDKRSIFICSDIVDDHEVDFYACGCKENNATRQLVVAILGDEHYGNNSFYEPAPMGYIDITAHQTHYSYGYIRLPGLFKRMVEVQKEYYK